MTVYAHTELFSGTMADLVALVKDALAQKLRAFLDSPEGEAIIHGAVKPEQPPPYPAQPAPPAPQPAPQPLVPQSDRSILCNNARLRVEAYLRKDMRTSAILKVLEVDFAYLGDIDNAPALKSKVEKEIGYIRTKLIGIQVRSSLVSALAL